MTPEEKANYLINKYFDAVEHRNTIRKLAKKLALICVSEIILACEYNLVETYNTDWWNKVSAFLK